MLRRTLIWCIDNCASCQYTLLIDPAKCSTNDAASGHVHIRRSSCCLRFSKCEGSPRATEVMSNQHTFNSPAKTVHAGACPSCHLCWSTSFCRRFGSSNSNRSVLGHCHSGSGRKPSGTNPGTRLVQCSNLVYYYEVANAVEVCKYSYQYGPRYLVVINNSRGLQG